MKFSPYLRLHPGSILQHQLVDKEVNLQCVFILSTDCLSNPWIVWANHGYPPVTAYVSPRSRANSMCCFCCKEKFDSKHGLTWFWWMWIKRHVVCPESSKFMGICVTFFASLGPHVPHMNYHKSRWMQQKADMNLANSGNLPPLLGDFLVWIAWISRLWPMIPVFK